MRTRRRYWTDAELATLRARYPHENTDGIARDLRRGIQTVYAKARAIGLAKTPERIAAAGRYLKGIHRSPTTEFKPGIVPWNKGTHYVAGGRSAETRFKKGNWPPNKDRDFYVPGALRVNTEGYIDMRTSFEPGALGWTPLHRVLWEDAHGAVPKGYALCFKNGDRLDVELANLELISRRELMRRNTVHNYPKTIARAIQLRGALIRSINKRKRDGKATADR